MTTVIKVITAKEALKLINKAKTIFVYAIINADIKMWIQIVKKDLLFKFDRFKNADGSIKAEFDFNERTGDLYIG